jgi:hypothetical protein
LEEAAGGVVLGRGIGKRGEKQRGWFTLMLRGDLVLGIRR